MMILRYSAASPYARKIRIAAELLGLSDRIEVVAASTTDPNDSLRGQNPLGKIPTLILDDGSALYDSRVIADYLDHLGGGKLIPAAPHRFDALRMQALGDGINDAALLIRYETAMRPPERRDQDTIDLQQGKIDRALASLDAEPPAGPVDIGHIAVACALGYLDLRFDGVWRAGHPKLKAWLADFEAKIPAFEATKA
ncbi:glutathione S-transferase [Methylocystis parvus]|uniref:Glutathione S-transferase n=1 Tax=Methylocystis parvus TaxID=134 RepID=A0A6B8M8J2_9HYPH|nr:glutathione S-transferase [Methylocystis parvus]QGM98906.1 glutathione S-transferase [Methylocystis parvus]WBK00738.1 glutathione S-transferase [Methylocystis parvus OBBP]